MAKINIYFEDLNEQTKDELWQEVRAQIKEQAREAIKNNPHLDLQSIESEMIDDYINEHNLANEFII